MRSVFFRSAVLLGALFALNACGGGGDGGKQAQFRVLNLSTGYDSLDIYTNNESDDDDSDAKQLSAVGLETLSNYVSVDSDTYSIKFNRANVASSLLTVGSQKLTDDSHKTYVAYGATSKFSSITIDDDQDDADAGKNKVTVYNTTEAGGLDVYLTEESVALDDTTPQFSSVAQSTASSTVIIDSGTYRLRVTGAGDTSDIRLDISGMTFESKQNVAIIFTPTTGGVLVNAMYLPQQGNITKFSNTKARVRAAVGIANGSAVIAKINGTSLLSNAAPGVIGSKYEQVDAGSLPVVLSIDGVAASIANQTVVAGGDYTFLVWSNTDGTQTSLISDDNRVPSVSTKAKIRVLNGMSGLAAPIDLYVDNSLVAEATDVGKASAPQEITAGTDFQFDIFNSNTSTNVLTVTGITLQSSSVYTLLMSGGGSTAAARTLRKDR